MVATFLAVTGGGRARADEPVAAAHVSALGGMIKRHGSIGADVFFDLGHQGFRLTLGAPLRFHPDSGLRGLGRAHRLRSRGARGLVLAS